MNSGILALFVRSMREDNRRITTYLVRFVVILLVLLVVGINHRTYRYGGGAPGLYVFQAVTMLNVAFICLVRLGYFRTAITEEKEDGTLGLLRMTNMSPLSILLGKSTSRLISFLILLATQLPFVTLAVALGGVSLNQIFTCYAILGAFTFLLSNLSLLFSVIFRRTSSVVTWTVLVLLFVTFGFWVIGAALLELTGTDCGFHTLAGWVQMASPTTALIQAFSLQSDSFSLFQPISNVVIGAIFFLASWALFDVFNQGEGRGATPAASRRKDVTSTTKNPSQLNRIPRPADFAVTWREFYFQCGGMSRLLLSFLLIAILIGGMIAFSASVGATISRDDFAIMCLYIGFLSAGIRWMFELGNLFKYERLNQTWASLTLLPKSIQRIAYEKVLASAISILPGLLIAGFGFVLLIDELRPHVFSEDLFLLLLYTAVWIIFGSHLIVYLSLWLRWGAVPLAVMSCFVLGFVATLVTVIFGFGRSSESYFLLSAFIVGGASVVLHVLIGSRLRTLAAQ